MRRKRRYKIVSGSMRRIVIATTPEAAVVIALNRPPRPRVLAPLVLIEERSMPDRYWHVRHACFAAGIRVED